MIFGSTPIYLVKLARGLTRPISPKWWFSKGNPLCLGKSKLVKYCNLARYIIYIYTVIIGKMVGAPWDGGPLAVSPFCWSPLKGDIAFKDTHVI